MKGILAILMAGMMMAVMIAPAMGADTSATVGNAAPDVTVTSVTSSANPGETITVSGTLSDPNGISDVSTLTYDVKYPDGTLYIDDVSASVAASWSFNFDLPTGSSAPPGTWTVEVTATDSASATDTDSGTFTMNSYVAITVGDMDYGSVSVPSTDNTGSHSVTNDGNVAIYFADGGDGYNDAGDGIRWIDMTSGSGTITANNIETTWTPATKQIAVGGNDNVGFELDVPLGTPTGTYTGTTTFTATQV